MLASDVMTGIVMTGRSVHCFSSFQLSVNWLTFSATYIDNQIGIKMISMYILIGRDSL